MKKFNLLLLLLSLSASLVAANSFEGEIYKDIDNLVGSVFKDLEETEGIIDNGYFYSAVEFSSQPLRFEEEILSEDELVEYLKRSLFTVFAYVNLNDRQKEKGAMNLLRKIRSKYGNDFSFFKRVRGVNISSISLTESCNVGGPEEEIYLKYRYSNTEAMVLKSDVCD